MSTVSISTIIQGHLSTVYPVSRVDETYVENDVKVHEKESYKTMPEDIHQTGTGDL